MRYRAMDAFTASAIDVGETTIFVRTGGSGPPLLLLHGFPGTTAERLTAFFEA